ncbi:hypothetical protein [Pseudogemmobacter sonorensis]|uniref:hypothetical protein n=1 Tax=Pseudogemmobacter sonorensis TaxID=2989681 RepID=UPI003675AAFB
MKQDPKGAFSSILNDAARATPGGLLDPASARGMVRRAVNMGVPREQAEEMVALLAVRPRHQITRGIE